MAHLKSSLINLNTYSESHGNKGQDMNDIITTEYNYDEELHKKFLGIEKDIYGNEFIYRPEVKMLSFQPESSKREDLIDILKEEIIERHKLNIEIIKAQLGCGTPNS
jgi:hypothetical protein